MPLLLTILYVAVPLLFGVRRALETHRETVRYQESRIEAVRAGKIPRESFEGPETRHLLTRRYAVLQAITKGAGCAASVFGILLVLGLVAAALFIYSLALIGSALFSGSAAALLVLGGGWFFLRNA